MCGITVAIQKNDKLVTPALIESMNNAIAHRGPNDQGTFFHERFAFGHRRLSILDLSPAGHQPMHRDGLTITYNGEIYNYLEIRKELEQLGHSFASATDTEVILAAYQEWGKASFSMLNGMWAFAIYDSRSSEIIFCRDHFGIKPLYYTATDDFFLAGSEIKQFSKTEGFQAELDMEVVFNFLHNSRLNTSSHTFFKHVSELPAGCYLTYSLKTHQVKLKRWFTLGEKKEHGKVTFQEACSEVRRLFLDSVRIRLRADVPVGSCLSGGIDSSAIVTTVHAHNDYHEDFATITSCYAEKAFDEQAFSDLVTEQTGFKALKVYPKPDEKLSLELLGYINYFQDQPIPGLSHFSEYSVFQKASEEGLTVMLDGQGSDEFFGGYNEFYSLLIRELLEKGKLAQAIRQIRLRSKAKKTGLLHELKIIARSSHLMPYNWLFVANNHKDHSWLHPDFVNKHLHLTNEIHPVNLRDLSLEELISTSLPYQLHSEDRNSMMFSIESRLPFLDSRLVEYVLNLPATFKVNKGFLKYILREALPELPQAIRYRSDKMGFVAPEALWLRTKADEIRQEFTQAVTSYEIFSPHLVTLFDQFVEGKNNDHNLYFRALSFIQFLKVSGFDQELMRKHQISEMRHRSQIIAETKAYSTHTIHSRWSTIGTSFSSHTRMVWPVPPWRGLRRSS